MTPPHLNKFSHKREFTGSYKWIIGYRVQGSQIQEIKHYHQKWVCISPLCFPVLASFSDSLFLHGRFPQVMSTLALVQSKKKKFLLPCAYSKYPRICLLWLDLVELWKTIHPQVHSHLEQELEVGGGDRFWLLRISPWSLQEEDLRSIQTSWAELERRAIPWERVMVLLSQ